MAGVMKHLSATTLLVAVAALMVGCAGSGATSGPDPSRASRLPEPPPMPRRAIAEPATPPPGETVELEEFDRTFTLFVPAGWRAPASGGLELAVHFHGAPWFAIQEHLRRGLDAPLVVHSPGQGSTIYRVGFEDPARFPQLLRRVEQELKARGAPTSSRVAAVDVTSFSAGYGAVRELVKQPAAFALLRRVILADSMYGSFAPGTTRPATEHVDVWVPLARAAMAGDKTFVLTHSQVPTDQYASTAQCAAALLEAVGVPRRTLSPGPSSPATTDPEFPLTYRADSGHFHVWGYGGADAAAHMTHPRHIADVWIALDAAGAP
jgi:hypothetical protein